MKISYKKLWVMLIQREITKVQLRADVGISAGTMSKLNKGGRCCSFCPAANL